MLIIFQYRDGGTRSLKPTETFFQRDKKGRLDIKAITEKVKDLCFDTGACYSCVATYGDKLVAEVLIEKNIPKSNKPTTSEEFKKQRIERRIAVANEKLKLENPKFSVVSKGGISYLINQK